MLIYQRVNVIKLPESVQNIYIYMAINPGRFTKPRNMDVLAWFQDAPKSRPYLLS